MLVYVIKRLYGLICKPAIYHLSNTKMVLALLVTEMSQQSSKLRRFEGSSNKNPRRYVDNDVIEQHQMIDRVRAYKQEEPPKITKVCLF